MNLEIKFLVIALLAMLSSIPISGQLSDKARENLRLQLETKQQQLDVKNAEQQELQHQNEELQKQLEAKANREQFLAKLEFSVGNAPAWKVRDALAFYLDRGLSKTASAYLVGNLVAESNLDHGNRSGDGGKAWGIAQWHPDRRRDMPHDFNGQLGFVLVEMARSRPEAHQIITNDPSPASAAQAMKIFEGYRVEGARFQYAEYILKRI